MRDRMIVAVTALLTTAAGIALAGLPPGYVWGLANCGPSVETSSNGCLLCCEDAFINGDIDAIELNGCQQMCGDSNFTRPSAWDTFWDEYFDFWTGWFR